MHASFATSRPLHRATVTKTILTHSSFNVNNWPFANTIVYRSGVQCCQNRSLQHKQLVIPQAVPTEATVSSLCFDGQCITEGDGRVIIRDDLDDLLNVLPKDVLEPLVNHPARPELLEIVLDLGRRPEARFLHKGEGEYLRDAEVSLEELQSIVRGLGNFGTDNRAGIAGTLHRISAIRNRRGTVIGLTCRVGRAVSGHACMIRDLLEAGQSVLLLGKPGVGKTTVIREVARILSDEMSKRVVVVDTSNEIGGDGDVPHPAIGGARRMQVADVQQQHKVMIEAVENHMPQIVIVDEVGTEAEALACRTIAERGVTLVATAHGQVLENLIKNPTLVDLVGGIQTVTLGDDEAKNRGTQKTIMERKGPPTFPVVIEIRDRNLYVTHNTGSSVDTILAGKVPKAQARRRDQATGEMTVEDVAYDKLPAPGAARPPRSVYDADYDSALADAETSGARLAMGEDGNRWYERLGALAEGSQELDVWNLESRNIQQLQRSGAVAYAGAVKKASRKARK